MTETTANLLSVTVPLALVGLSAVGLFARAIGGLRSEIAALREDIGGTGGHGERLATLETLARVDRLPTVPRSPADRTPPTEPAAVT